MTHLVATCDPETHISEVAATMRDLNIGDVLVVKDNKVRGIVTDRDLTTRALSGQADPSQTPVSQSMTDKVITGQPDWSLDQVAHTLAKHKIRRLPIVQAEKLVGIISLGDLARRAESKNAAAKSLQAISTPIGSVASKRSSGAPVLAFLGTLVTGAVAWLTLNHSGQTTRKHLADSRVYHSARQIVSAARGKVDQAAQSKAIH
jgi:CBS domain-containing protein